MKRLGGLFLGCALVFSPAVARADARSDAAALFREGQGAFSRKSYRAAALAFEEANRRSPSAAATYNAALAWKREGSLDRAGDDFALALADPAFEGAERTDATTQLAEVERAVGVVDVTAPRGSTVTVSHVERAPTPVRVHLVPGDYDVVVTPAAGASITRSIHAVAGATERVVIEAPTPTPVRPFERPQPIAPVPSPVQVQDSGLSTGKQVGIASLALSGVCIGATAFFGVRTLSSKSDFTGSGNRDANARDDIFFNRTATNISLAAAGVFVVTGIVLLLTSR